MRTGVPLVSVVIPTYNQADLLQEAIRSVQRQTFSDWEVLVINNYSQDHTKRVVSDYGDPRIVAVDLANNGVIAASRNEGIRLARGKYVAFLDSDDTWAATKLGKCVAALEGGCDLVCHGTVWRWDNGKTRNAVHGPASKATYQALLYGRNRLATSATVARTSLLEEMGGFDVDPDIVTAEDYDLWLRIARSGSRLCFLPEMLGVYRKHAASASANVVSTKAVLAVLEKHFRAEPDSNYVSRLRRRIRRSSAISTGGLELSRQGDWKEAVKLFGRAVAVWPLNLKGYVGGLFATSRWAASSPVIRRAGSLVSGTKRRSQ